MEKTNKKERSCGSCKKFINAIGLGSVVRAIRDASHGRQRPVAASVVPATAAASGPNPNPATKIAGPSIGPETKPGGTVLNKPPSFAVKMESHRPPASAPDKTGQNGGKKVEIPEQHVENAKTVVDIEHRVGQFLSSAKEKMRRTFSDIGGGNTLPRKESNKDHSYMEYINRAKNKLRTASFGDAKNSASK